MAMHSLLLVLLFTVLASYSHNTRCIAQKAGGPPEGLTVQFTPYYPRQIPPTSTVYGAIVTNIHKVVDCDYVQVENVDDNPVQEGQYFYRTTVPVLTQHRVTCMDPSTIITREAKATAVAEPPPKGLEIPILDKRTGDNTAALGVLFNVAEHLSTGIDPSNENITVREFNFLRQINTALFSLNVVSSGLNLTVMCGFMKDPIVEYNLENNYINSKQASDIICFASVFGLYLGQSTDQVLANLAALEYAVQTHAYHSGSLTQACKELSYSAAQKLGIDADGIQQYICNGTAGVSQSSTFPPASNTANNSATVGLTSVSLPFPTASLGTAWTSQGTNSSWRPVLPTPFPATVTSVWNTSMSTPTDSSFGTGSTQSTPITKTESSVIFGTGGSVLSSATSAAGTVVPWFNGTMTSQAPAVGTVDSAVPVDAQTAPSRALTQAASFYMPPRLVRERFRRHG